MIEQLVVSLLPVTVSVIQLTDSYLRYLAFKAQISSGQKHRLLWALLGYALLSVAVYFYFFQHYRVGAGSYKLVLMTGWIPFLLIFMLVVPREVLRHIFVHGMVALWSFTLHSLNSIIVVLCCEGMGDAAVLAVHALLYVGGFVLLLPVEQRIFTGITIPGYFFARKSYSCYLAFFPYVILFGPMLLFADRIMYHTWPERISRLVVPVIFWVFYRYMHTVSEEFIAKRQARREEQRMKEQIAFWERRQMLSGRMQKQLSLLRSDLRHRLRELYALLSRGDLNTAITELRAQEDSLPQAPHTVWVKDPLLNATLCVHFWRAERLGIKLSPLIQLEQEQPASAQELSLLLSELLDQALEVCEKEASEERAIRFCLQSRSGSCRLEIISGRPGEPENTREERGGAQVQLVSGTGADIPGPERSCLREFLRKYQGQVSYTAAHGQVRCVVEWQEAAAC